MTNYYTQQVPGKFGFGDFFVALDASVIHLRWFGFPVLPTGYGARQRPPSARSVRRRPNCTVSEPIPSIPM